MTPASINPFSKKIKDLYTYLKYLYKVMAVILSTYNNKTVLL